MQPVVLTHHFRDGNSDGLQAPSPCSSLIKLEISRSMFDNPTAESRHFPFPEGARMSYSKAADLLRVADMATARFDGVSLQDIRQEFGCDHRTAQRIMRAFENVFPQVEVREDADRGDAGNCHARISAGSRRRESGTASSWRWTWR